MSGSYCRIAAIFALVLVTGCATPTAPRKTLQAFASDQEITELFKGWAEELQRRLEEERRQAEEARRKREEERRVLEEARRAAGETPDALVAKPAPAPPPKMMAPPPAKPVAKAKPASPAAQADSVTNVQHAGVDEGGIVKLHGDYLIILRRGRLFTVDIRDRQLTPISTIDAFGAGIEPRGAWYDEMLISGNRIVVVGYSYARGGTEIGLFEISPAGELTYRATYHLRSNDYYSSRNYASRLIGSKLIFYTPLRINPWNAFPLAEFPGMRKWQSGAATEFKRIAPATRIYRTDEPLDPYQGIALHTVSICDLARPELECESTAVLGPPGRVFYVSGGSVFVWTTAMRRSGTAAAGSAAVFRIPLDGSAPSALKVAGSPIDQFSFLEGEDGFLNVLVRAGGRGDGMWAAEVNAGDLALLRAPLSSFSDGRDAAPPESYTALPKPSGFALQSRYVGPYLLYGAGTGWNRPNPTLHSQVYAVRYANAAPVHEVPLAHGVDRIETLSDNAVVVGTDGRDLHFTSLRLARLPMATDRYTRKDAAQGETRSHGFYYKQESDDGGLIGLPIIGRGAPASRQLSRQSAAVLFLRNQSLKLNELGALDSHIDAGNVKDGCRASCVDWYGNSRPLFVKTRVFALMGYEIVEGQIFGDKIVETQRISFAPRPR